MNSCSRSMLTLAATIALTHFVAAEAQTQPTPNAGAPPQGTVSPSQQAAPSVLIYVELSKSLDSKKAKSGDLVEAKTLQEIKAPNGTSIPRGSRVVGHVTQASPHTKEHPQAQLGMVFEKIVTKSGGEFPLHGVLQAVAVPENAPSNAGGGLGQAGASGQQQGSQAGSGQQAGMAGQAGTQADRSSAAGASGAQGTGAGTDVNSMGAGSNAAPAASGVTGLKDVGLAPGPEPALSSNSHNIHLDSGSMITVRVFPSQQPR